MIDLQYSTMSHRTFSKSCMCAAIQKYASEGALLRCTKGSMTEYLGEWVNMRAAQSHDSCILFDYHHGLHALASCVCPLPAFVRLDELFCLTVANILSRGDHEVPQNECHACCAPHVFTQTCKVQQLILKRVKKKLPSRIELETFSLQARCSATELWKQFERLVRLTATRGRYWE